jgi:hypothetical protein
MAIVRRQLGERGGLLAVNCAVRRFGRWSASGVWESVAIALAETIEVRNHV